MTNEQTERLRASNDRESLEAYRTEINRLRARLAVVDDFCAERAEYITSINNCGPDNDRDYWRWNGHAEARRQLSEHLGLLIAWPKAEVSE